MPPQSVAATWDKLVIASPHVSKEWNFPQPAGHVYDFRALKRGLLEQAAQSGADIRLGYEVTEMRRINDQTEVLTAKGESCMARIVVDASGPTGVLAWKAGLRERKLCPPSSGLEVCVEHESFRGKQRTMQVFFGSTWAPCGYAWIFPMGGTQLKAGVCTFQPETRTHDADLNVMLKNFMDRLPWLACGRIVETHGGYLYLTGGIPTHVKDNLIVIGDAADQTHPLYGEGIRHVLQSARFAKGVILEALDANTIAALQSYDPLWKAYIGKQWSRAAKIGRRVYPNMRDKTYDRIMRVVSHLPAQEVFDIGFRYKKFSLIKGMLLAWIK